MLGLNRPRAQTRKHRSKGVALVLSGRVVSLRISCRNSLQSLAVSTRKSVKQCLDFWVSMGYNVHTTIGDSMSRSPSGWGISCEAERDEQGLGTGFVLTWFGAPPKTMVRCCSQKSAPQSDSNALIGEQNDA
jgi:hypothetical protein